MNSVYVNFNVVSEIDNMYCHYLVGFYLLQWSENMCVSISYGWTLSKIKIAYFIIYLFLG